jgi:hypothetical protein
MVGDRNQTTKTLNRWRSETDTGDGKSPRATRIDNNGNRALYSDRWIEDGWFLRLKNVTFSYNIPKSVTDHLKIAGCKVALTAQNVFTLTNYSGFDPEVSSNGQSAYFPGYDTGGYPLAKSFLLSVNVNF